MSGQIPSIVAPPNLVRRERVELHRAEVCSPWAARIRNDVEAMRQEELEKKRHEREKRQKYVEGLKRQMQEREELQAEQRRAKEREGQELVRTIDEEKFRDSAMGTLRVMRAKVERAARDGQLQAEWDRKFLGKAEGLVEGQHEALIVKREAKQKELADREKKLAHQRAARKVIAQNRVLDQEKRAQQKINDQREVAEMNRHAAEAELAEQRRKEEAAKVFVQCTEPLPVYADLLKHQRRQLQLEQERIEVQRLEAEERREKLRERAEMKRSEKTKAAAAYQYQQMQDVNAKRRRARVAMVEDMESMESDIAQFNTTESEKAARKRRKAEEYRAALEDQIKDNKRRLMLQKSYVLESTPKIR